MTVRRIYVKANEQRVFVWFRSDSDLHLGIGLRKVNEALLTELPAPASVRMMVSEGMWRQVLRENGMKKCLGAYRMP